MIPAGEVLEEEHEGVRRRNLVVSKSMTMVNGIITLIFYVLGGCLAYLLNALYAEIEHVMLIVILIVIAALGVFFTGLFFSHCSKCSGDLDTKHIDLNIKGHDMEMNSSSF